MNNENNQNSAGKYPEPFIKFQFEGVEYKVGMKAFVTHYIGLPDGRIISVNQWSEVYPPYPSGLVVVENVPEEKIVKATVFEKQ